MFSSSAYHYFSAFSSASHFAQMLIYDPCKGRLLLTGYMQQKEQFRNYSGAPANLETLKRGAHCVML